MIITSEVLRENSKGFRKLYDGGLANAGAPRVDRYCLRTTSSKAAEVYAWLGSIPMMKKIVGEPNIQNLVNHGFSVANDPFSVIIGVKREDIERDNLNIYGQRFTAMGKSAGRHPDKLLAAAMIGGFTTPCYTGKMFFDTDHEPQAGKVKFSNLGTKKLSQANFQTAVKTLKSMQDAEGEPINEAPELVLTVSPTYEYLAKQILEAAEIDGETNVTRGAAKLDVWNRLSGNEHMWFLSDHGAIVKPFVNQVEVPTEFTAKDKPTDDNAFYLQEYHYQSYGRYMVAALVPELCYGSTGADAA